MNKLIIILLLIPISAFGQRYTSLEDNFSDPLDDVIIGYEIKRKDAFKAFIPGAVQLRKKWNGTAYAIWGGMAISGGITAYEHFHIIKLQHDSDNDPSNANWYDGKIRQSKKVRNASLYALGGIYIANYVSALLLPDRDPRTNWISFYADPQGNVGLYLAFSF